MILDISIVAILLFFAIYGFKKGFLFTVIHTVGWAVALVGALALAIIGGNFFKTHGVLFSRLLTYYKTRFSAGSASASDSINSLPSIFGDTFDNLAESFAAISYPILLFAILFIVIKIVLWLILRLGARNYRHGFSGFFDGFFGMLFGLLKGAIFIFVLLAIMAPISSFLPPDLTATFASQMDTSYFAKTLYDNNLISIFLMFFNVS